MQIITDFNLPTTYGPLSGATAIWAERNASMAATTDGTTGNFQGWGDIASSYYARLGESEAGGDQMAVAGKLFVMSGPSRSMVEGAFVQADGSVVFRNAFFATQTGQGEDLWLGGSPYYRPATWLPAIRELVSNRRQVNGAWPSEANLAVVMPIVRTETDAVLYLDGMVIKGADGLPLVLP
jgi:hypothetical protein